MAPFSILLQIFPAHKIDLINLKIVKQFVEKCLF